MNESIYKLSRVSGAPVSDEELLDDLQRISSLNNGNKLSQRKYKELGGVYGCSTYLSRFGSWNKVLSLLGVPPANEINLSEQRLFENLFILWQYYGRQPRRNELASPPSTITQSPYNRTFGSWTASLEAFVNYANASELETAEKNSNLTQPNRRKTGRDPSLRLRWKVLQRDRFSCRNCGKSPALALGIELHVDHIVPWSKGGETVFENLQTLCSDCNLGKSNESI